MDRFIIFLMLALAAAGGGAGVVLYEDATVLDWNYEAPAPDEQYFAAWYPEYWEQQIASIPEQAQRSWPKISFTDFLAVGAYLGERPTGGYQIRIGRLELQGEWLIATVYTSSPRPGSMVTQAFTYPSDVVTVDKSLLTRADAVPGGVRFLDAEGEVLSEVMFVDFGY